MKLTMIQYQSITESKLDPMSIGQYPLIPRQAFLYFPQEDDIFQRRNKKPYRIIFEGGVPFTPEEKDKLNQLHSEIKKDVKHHHLVFKQESTLLRFLQATKYDIDDCLQELHKYTKWEDSIFPLILKPDIQHLLKQGFFYMVGRDCKFRPIIVVNVEKLHEADLKEKTFYDVIGYFFQYVVQNCLLEGQIQTWVTIVDLAKMGLFSLGGTVMDTIKFLSRRFKCRLHHNYLVNCPGSITFLFGMVKRVLNQDQIAKISLTEEEFLPQKAFYQISLDQIQKKYGGTKENCSEFWPIQYSYHELNIMQEDQLISVTEYGQMHENGLLSLKKVSKDLLQQYNRLKQHINHGARITKRQSLKIDSILQKKISKQLMEEQEQSQPSQEDPPEIQDIPPPFSMQDFFKTSHSETIVDLNPKKRQVH